jgi:hypothetical protein
MPSLIQGLSGRGLCPLAKSETGLVKDMSLAGERKDLDAVWEEKGP